VLDFADLPVFAVVPVLVGVLVFVGVRGTVTSSAALG
jgi:hypothetical protein